jgi:hypothetical protein
MRAYVRKLSFTDNTPGIRVGRQPDFSHIVPALTLPEKETVIKPPARQLQGNYPANRRKKEKPADNQKDNDKDESTDPGLGSILLHTMTSGLPV